MRNRAPLLLIGLAAAAAAARAVWTPFPGIGDNPFLDLIAYNDPAIYTVIRAWHYAAPAVAVLLAGSLCLSVLRVWIEPRGRAARRGAVPPRPASRRTRGPRS